MRVGVEVEYLYQCRITMLLPLEEEELMEAEGRGKSTVLFMYIKV